MKAARRDLLDWYRAHRRPLPWRATRDPYSIWVSEAMLQQTRVETVIPYYERFLARFPDVESLARAELDDVLGLWAGLGYYSRARNLWSASRRVAERHGGRIPDDVETLRSLPGVGRYTAGALASIAFDRPEPVLDGNVVRVLARWLGVREDPKRAPVARRLWAAAAALARGPHPGELNQALMELGATRCTPRAPRCPECPLARGCRARRAGDPEALPVRAPRREPPRIEAVAALVLRRGRALAVRRPPRGLLGGLWELPGGERRGRERSADAVGRSLRERLGLEAEVVRRLGRVEHAFTHRRLRLHVFRCEGVSGRTRARGWDAHRWLAPAALAALPQGAATRKALRLALGASDPA